MLSDRVNRIALSPTLRISARAGQMRAAGVDVVDLSAGEPDFPTPEAVKKAAKAALDANYTKYVANDGIAELKAAIVAKHARDGIRYAPDEILVSPGAKNSLFNAALALFSPGDDVLIPSPYWVSYPDQVTLAGANPVYVPTREEDGFRLDPERLAASITPNTRALILNYPGNPTGALYDRDQLERIARVCIREGLWIVSDEIYERLVYDGERHVSIASLSEEIRSRTITVNGFSKAYSMTGWRLGWAAGPREVIAACSKIQSHNTSNATSFVQKAAVAALTQCDPDVERMRREFERRRTLMLNRLRALPAVSCPPIKGAFYAFANFARYMDREFRGAPIRNSYGLAYYLLQEAKVAVVPGEAFGSPEHLRLSFATSAERIEEGLRRIGESLARLEAPRRVRPRALNNVLTKVRSRVEARELRGEAPARALAEAEERLTPDGYFEWNAAIAGVVVQLRTNSPHLADFYQENFYPAPLDGEIAPHAVVYAVKDVPGKEAQASLAPEGAAAFVVNTAWYGQLRAAALALAGRAAERADGALLAACAALDRGGAGALVWAAPGSNRAAILAAALREEGVRLVSIDALLVHGANGVAEAELPERKLYLPATWLTAHPETEKFLERTKLENMVVSHDACTVEFCPQATDCSLDRGAAACARASVDGRMMVDPYWLKAGTGHVRRTRPRLAVLLTADPAAPAAAEVSGSEAARRLAEGRLGAPGARAVPFLDPRLPALDQARQDRLRAQHERLLSGVRCLVVNAALGAPDSVARRILQALPPQ